MITVCDVGPRDGLQNEREILSPATRAELITRLARAGVTEIEAVSFVNPRVVPQMAGAEEVLDLLPHDLPVRLSGLVLSASGLKRALQTRLAEIHLVLAVSDTFNYKNARRTAEESAAELERLMPQALAAGKAATIVLGTSFGCPFEGDVWPARVLAFARRFIDAGCTKVVYADTTGMANPAQVQRMVTAYDEAVGIDRVPLGLHFHNTRGLGLANVYAGYAAGVTRFDASIGGLGGCPFAPKAVGNVCTEDMVNMFQQMGATTPCDLDTLIGVARWTEDKVGRRLDGLMMKLD
ncbi:hydroxymethylglutaryl-CoA lyase [Alicyclobacillus sp. ALC3]|uniref:hydroxymethylglutaryl-CoA lyase n=1 Tax=Alicyclobacillus sp. ALC3 TaxID=2796143 RepID=UPI00237968C5|nr:hydroxymethylglutaryl-CoA lyase [Alicyclobacillus sp. ALC3]WDL97609.1 hydroxymethylglutaryl-CoA lyase [Alicyclobacillus sp. ALC3]